MDVKNNLFENDTYVKINHKSDFITKENKKVNSSDLIKQTMNLKKL